jgi:hypothetical protein
MGVSVNDLAVIVSWIATRPMLVHALLFSGDAVLVIKGSRWAAQHSCDMIRAGNLMLASALLLFVNSYTKVGLMFRFCNLQYFSKTLFTQY